MYYHVKNSVIWYVTLCRSLPMFTEVSKEQGACIIEVEGYYSTFNMG
jgi:hypothetical protein